MGSSKTEGFLSEAASVVDRVQGDYTGSLFPGHPFLAPASICFLSDELTSKKASVTGGPRKTRPWGTTLTRAEKDTGEWEQKPALWSAEPGGTLGHTGMPKVQGQTGLQCECKDGVATRLHPLSK